MENTKKISSEMKEALNWLWQNTCSYLEKELKGYEKNKQQSGGIKHGNTTNES